MKISRVAMIATAVLVSASCASTDALTSPDAATAETAETTSPTTALFHNTFALNNTPDPIAASITGPDSVTCGDARYVVRVAGVAGGNHDVIALMDGSGSLGAEDWTRSKLALTALVNTFEWGPSLNRLGILRYSTGVDTIVPLNFPLQNADSSDVNQDILNASIAGMTYPRGYAYMKDAVEAAIDMFDAQGRSNASKTIVFFTDGVPNPSFQSPCTLATALASRGIEVKIIMNGSNATTRGVSCLVGDTANDITPLADVQWAQQIDMGEPRNVTWTGTYDAQMSYAGSLESRGSVYLNSTTHQIRWDLGRVPAGSQDSFVIRLHRPAANGTVTAFTKDSIYYRLSTVDIYHAISLGDVQTSMYPCDNSAPVIAPTATGTTGANGWYVSDVHLVWSVVDAESPVISADTACATAKDITTDTEGTVFTCSATSTGGTTSESVTIKRDVTRPVITFGAHLPSYKNNESISITCTATDATSGIDPDHTACVTYSAAPHTLSVGTHEFVANATDMAGNATSDTVRFEVIPSDVTPPVIVGSVTGQLGQNGWYTSAVSVSWNVTDAESAISARSGCETISIGTDTNGQTVTCTATSLGGTDSRSETVKVDRTAPVVAFSGNAGTYAASAMIHITCSASDAMSGVATSNCANVDGPAYSFGVGAHSISATATDRAGNEGGASAMYTVTVDVASINAVIDQLIGDANVANGLRAKLDAIGNGNARNKANLVRAFVNQVEAQRGKKLSNAVADLLIGLVGAL
jgi:hypothetical protein